jgi:CcmD family protein
MPAFATAYLAAWLVFVAYLAWLGRRQRRLERDLAALSQRLAGREAEMAGRSEAA